MKYINSEYINNLDEELKSSLGINKEQLYIVLNTIYKLGHTDSFDKIKYWDKYNTKNTLNRYTVYAIYDIFHKTDSYINFDIVEAVKDIYNDLIKDKKVITVKNIIENYILKIIEKINPDFLTTNKNTSVKKEKIMNKQTKMKEVNITPNALFLKTFMYDPRYRDELEKSSTVEEFLENLGKMNDMMKIGTDSMLDLINTHKNTEKQGYALLVKDFNNAKESIGSPVGSGMKSEKVSLKSYLHKKLTISEKEASLIESVIRDYVRKKKR